MFVLKNSFMEMLMTSVLSAMIAVVAFAVVNVIIAHKLSGVSALVMVPAYTLVVGVTTLCIGRAANALGHAVPFPTGANLYWLVAIGLIFVVGDLAYMSAYGMKGASMATITTCAALVPVIATVIEKLCVGGTLPSARTMFAFGLSIFTVWLVAFDPANMPIKH